ncbi:MAG TPA: hypothetical protein VIW69_14740 [Candidatus Elarobacter sp.]
MPRRFDNLIKERGWRLSFHVLDRRIADNSARRVSNHPRLGAEPHGFEDDVLRDDRNPAAKGIVGTTRLF